MTTLRQALEDAEVAIVRFDFALAHRAVLPPHFALTLRPQLHRIGRERLDPETFDRLFDPPLPRDPTALRKHQRPSPPFALQPAPLSGGVNDRFTLSLHLFGAGIELLDPLCDVFRGLTAVGTPRLNRIALQQITGVDAAGTRSVLWSDGTPPTCAAPPRIVPRWLFDTATEVSALEVVTPARLISGGKPLFAPSFRRLLPFVARRVTAVLNTWCNLEIETIPALMTEAETISAETDFHWEDWRTLGDGEGLGGVLGRVRFNEPLPEGVSTLLRLGSLMNFGKGASYGAGAYRVEG